MRRRQSQLAAAGRLIAPALTLFPVLIAFGCTGLQVDSAVRQHQAVVGQINIGDSKETVIPKLEAMQAGLPLRTRKNPDQYVKDGKTYFVFYARSARQADDITTDDEFTPYVFVNGRLEAIGWQTLGGPKSQGQARDVIIVQ